MGFIIHKLSFAAGELSPWLDGRTDLDKYGAGCRSLCNYIALPQGGIQKRPGMEYLGEMVAGATAGRLIEFQVSTTEAAMLVLGGGKLAVWVNGAAALGDGSPLPAAPIELTMPWADADLPLLRWKQINDVMWLVHPSHAPRKLVRYAADDWELTVADNSLKPALLAENADDDWTLTTTFTVGGSPPAWSNASVSYAAGARVTRSAKSWVCMKAHVSSNAMEPGAGTAVYNEIVYVNGRAVDVVSKPIWVEGFADLAAVKGQSITVTSNRNTWVAGHVGAIWEISKKRVASDYETYIKAILANDGKYSPTIVVQGGWNFMTFGTWKGTFTIEKSEDRGATWTAVREFESEGERNVNVEGEEPLRCLMRVKWTHVLGGSTDPRGLLAATDGAIRGLVRITAVTDARTVTAEVITPVEKCTTYLWAEGAWSGAQGYPRTVELHQARIVMGGTTLKPHTIFGSAVDDYDNFYPGTDADQAYRHTVAIGEKDPILWLVSERFLLIGTGAGEWVMHGEDEEKAITPEFGTAKRHSSYGAHNGGVPACFADSVSLFVQRGGTRVREFAYKFEADRYEAGNLNLLADHLFTAPIDDIAVQRMPWQVVWFVSDGKLYGLTFERSQNVAAWHRHETAGEVLSAATIRGADAEDEVWFLVDRGQGSIFIERFRPGHMSALPDDGWWQDSAVSVAFPYDAANAAHLDGLEITGHAQGMPFGPVEAAASGGWPFVTGQIMGFDGGNGGLVQELLWKEMGRRYGKPWFAWVDDETWYIQWTVHLGTARWQIFRAGLVVLESEEDTEQPHQVTTWTPTEEGATVPIVTADFRASAVTLPPNAWGPVTVTGVTVPDIAGIPLVPIQPGSFWGLHYRAVTDDFNDITLFYVSTGGGTWRLRIEGPTGSLIAEFRSNSDVANPFEATGWALTSGSATGVPVLVADLPGTATAIVGLPFTAHVSPMVPEIPLANGSSRSREFRAHRLALSLKDSRGGKIGETLDGKLDPLPVGSATELFTGEHEKEFESGYTPEVPVVVVSDEPFPHAVRTLAFKANAFGDP